MPISRKTLGAATTAVLTATLATTFVVTQGREASRAPAGVVTGAVTELPDRIASLASNDFEKASPAGRHLGFDTYAYPGDDVMRAWRHKDVPYEWVGYYLPAPCHKGRTWMGKRERLAEMGWGMAVVYVGQQTWDKTPSAYETSYVTRTQTKFVKRRVKQTVRLKSGKKSTRYVTKSVPVKQSVRVPVRTPVVATARPLDQCNTNLVTGPRGAMEADDAIARTAAEGFPKGTVIFLDIERMERTPQGMRDYYRAWTKRVLEDGRYRPGYYVHKHNADRVYVDVKAEYIAAGMTGEPPFWIAGGKDFSPDKAPHEVGRAYAAAWQGVLDVVQEWKGYTLPLDVNVAHVPDPSHQYVAAD